MDGLDDLESELIVGGKTGINALNEVNFHLMNRCMPSGWKAIHEGGWGSEGNRLHRIGAAERSLAISGFVHYATRERSDRSALFEGQLQDIHRVVSGMVQEFDAALVLLGVVRRHPNLAVVPAPLNFERTKKRTNVDFVVVDCVDRKAVGVQVKTNVRNHEFDKADQSRVVFLDGTVDFDNIRAMRTSRKSSAVRTVCWSGMIAAKAVDIMKPEKYGVKVTPLLKRLAHQMIGDVKVDYSEIVDKAEDRILARL